MSGGRKVGLPSAHDPRAGQMSRGWKYHWRLVLAQIMAGRRTLLVYNVLVLPLLSLFMLAMAEPASSLHIFIAVTTTVAVGFCPNSLRWNYPELKAFGFGRSDMRKNAILMMGVGMGVLWCIYLPLLWALTAIHRNSGAPYLSRWIAAAMGFGIVAIPLVNLAMVLRGLSRGEALEERESGGLKRLVGKWWKAGSRGRVRYVARGGKVSETTPNISSSLVTEPGESASAPAHHDNRANVHARGHSDTNAIPKGRTNPYSLQNPAYELFARQIHRGLRIYFLAIATCLAIALPGWVLTGMTRDGVYWFWLPAVSLIMRFFAGAVYFERKLQQALSFSLTRQDWLRSMRKVVLLWTPADVVLWLGMIAELALLKVLAPNSKAQSIHIDAELVGMGTLMVLGYALASYGAMAGAIVAINRLSRKMKLIVGLGSLSVFSAALATFLTQVKSSGALDIGQLVMRELIFGVAVALAGTVVLRSNLRSMGVDSRAGGDDVFGLKSSRTTNSQ